MRSLLLLMCVTGTLPMAFVRPVIGLLLWMVFSYMNPHRYTYGFAVDFPWVVIVAVATLLALLAHPEERQAPPFKFVVVLMTLFLFWTSLSTLQAFEPDGALDTYEQFVKMMVMTYVTLILVIDLQRLNWVIWTIVASFGFWGLKGGLFTLLTGGNYHVVGPAHSFFTDNNIFALVMCMALPLMRYTQLHTGSRWIRIGLWILMAFTVVSIIGTYSRGGLLGLAITGVMLIWKSRRRGMLLIIAPILVVGLAVFMPPQYFKRMNTIDNYQQDASAQGRIQSWKFATNVALARPVLGGGMDVWASHKQWRRFGPTGAAPGRAIHSVFFEVLGEQGFVGLAIFVLMLITGYMALGRIRRTAKTGPESIRPLSDLASMMQISLIAYGTAGALLPVPYIDFLYQLLAIIAVMQVLVHRVPASGETGSSQSSSSPSQIDTSKQPLRARPRQPAAGALPKNESGTRLPDW